MNKLTSILATTALALSFVCTANAEQPAPVRYELRALASQTAGSCPNANTFRRELVLCNGTQCTRLDVSGAPIVQFALTPSARATLTTIAHDPRGQSVGRSQSSRLDAAASPRFSHTVSTGDSCSQSVAYELSTSR